MEMENDNDLQKDVPDVGAASDEATQTPVADRALVQRILKTIKDDKKYHEKAFKRMRRDMFVATNGREDDWSENNYKANISGRHVKQKTASLYAKNPKASAKRRETLDFVVWDETQESLMLAMQTVQQAEMMLAEQQAMPTIDEFGMPVPPQMPPGYEQAQGVIMDFQQGMTRRQHIKKLGKTLEVLFAQALHNQKPLDFKTAMKQVVRRACTTGVGYVEIGFQRETGPRPGLNEQLADFRQRLDHLRRLTEEVEEGEITENDAEMAELQKSIMSLEAEPEIVLREGLVFDFPLSTRVIPDKLCKSITGFVGARHLTVEYHYSKEEVREIFGVDIGKNYTPYSMSGQRTGDQAGVNSDEQGELFNDRPTMDEMACVWKFYDKASGLMYFVCDGYHGFLREPSAPEVFVEDFWPVYALTFNEVENEDDLFPPSDVTILLDVQREVNRSRQGKREHREAARPRWGYSNGVMTEKDIDSLQRAKPFDAIGMQLPPDAKLSDILQAIPVPGVDPNLYDTNEVWADAQVTVGASQAAFGGVSKATATEVSVAANSMTAADSSSVDDLDAFLTAIARSSGQILLREMSEEQAKRIAGPGAVWVDATMVEIYDEIYLEVEAGSTGKPNQAVEIDNWKQLLPFLIQMPGIPPTWLARETLRRLDDRMDLTEAVVAGVPSIMVQNQMAQPGTGDPASDPNAQGEQGGDNAERGQQGNEGSDAPMGDNNPTPQVIRYGADGSRLSG
jgi:hypothetical protein